MKTVSAVDFAPSMLSLQGIKIPAYMQGQAFLGSQTAKDKRKYIFSARDRMDEKYDRVRAVRDKKFRYLYNYMPDTPYYQNLTYRLSIPMMKEFLQLKDAGSLDEYQMAWFKSKPVEELYDLEADPDELHNIAGDAKYREKLDEMRNAFQQWTKQVGDMSDIPETEMIWQWWNGKSGNPSQATRDDNGKRRVKISCKTIGASVGYQVIKKGMNTPIVQHVVHSWDAGGIFGASKNGQLQTAAPAWNLYKGELIPFNKGDTIVVNAMRIGYKAAEIRYAGDIN
jgi:hypothetical protein